MNDDNLLPLLYDADTTAGWTAGMVRVTLALLAAAPPVPGSRWLEVGCGSGAVARAVQSAWPATRMAAVDLHPLALAAAHARTAGDQPAYARTNLLALPFAPAALDGLLALDSFDQVGVDLGAALAEARRVLRPGGQLLLRVSAHPALQGAHDVAFNTGRRYCQDEIHQSLRAAGFAPSRTTYANTLLAPPVVALRLLDRLRTRADHKPHTGRSAYASPLANRAVAAALTLESIWLRRGNLPAGLSLLVLAERR